MKRILVVVIVGLLLLIGNSIRIRNQSLSDHDYSFQVMDDFVFVDSFNGESIGGATSYYMGFDINWKDMGQQRLLMDFFIQAHYIQEDGNGTMLDSYWGPIPEQMILLLSTPPILGTGNDLQDTFVYDYKETDNFTYPLNNQEYVFSSLFFDVDHQTQIKDNWSYISQMEIKEKFSTDSGDIDLRGVLEFVVANSIVQENYNGICSDQVCIRSDAIRFSAKLVYQVRDIFSWVNIGTTSIGSEDLGGQINNYPVKI